MNLEELRKKLIASARTVPADERVPYTFEQRVMHRLLSQPMLDIGTQWARALWRAAAPCVAIMLCLAAWSWLQPPVSSSSRANSVDLAQDFDNTLLAAWYPEPPAAD